MAHALRGGSNDVLRIYYTILQKITLQQPTLQPDDVIQAQNPAMGDGRH